MNKFADRARKLRNQLGFSQTEMAERMGITRSYYSSLETGKAEPSDTLARMLGLIDALEEGGRLAEPRREYGGGRELVAISEEHAPAPAPPDRRRCERLVRDYLDAAEKRGALAHAWFVLRKNLRLEDFELFDENEKEKGEK